MNNSISIVGKG